MHKNRPSWIWPEGPDLTHKGCSEVFLTQGWMLVSTTLAIMWTKHLISGRHRDRVLHILNTGS